MYFECTLNVLGVVYGFFLQASLWKNKSAKISLAWARSLSVSSLQRFVSSTGNMEVLLSHIGTFNCVCEHLFLGCQKSCQMFMILHEKYLKCWEEFSYWLREYV